MAQHGNASVHAAAGIPAPEASAATSLASGASAATSLGDHEPLTPLFLSCKEEVLAILNRQDKDEKIVQVADQLEGLFTKMGLMYRMQIAPRQVGWDSLNRHGEGGSPNAVFTLMERVAATGWSWDKCSHATCIEAVPGDDTLYEFNEKVCRDTGLAPVEKNTLMFGSLSAGHTNMGLRALAARMPSTLPHLSDGARFCVDTLRKHDELFAEAVDKGLRWKVLKHEVRRLFPAALTIIQAANNVAGHIQRPENEVAGLLQLWQLAVRDMACGRDPDWVGIRRMVLKTAPPYTDYIDSLINFVAEKAGGQDGEHLQDLVSFWRANINPTVRKCLPSNTWDALANCKYVLVSLALFKAAYACPLSEVRHGVCQWLRASEVQALARGTGQLAERAQKAERLLAEIRTATALTDLPKPVRDHKKLARAFYRFEGQLAQYVLNRFFEKSGEAMSLRSISEALLEEVREEYPKANLLPLDLALPAKEEVQKTDKGARPSQLPASQVHQITLTATSSTGQVLGVRARLRAQGFELAGLVKTTLGDVGRITGVCEQKGEVILDVRAATSPKEATGEKRLPVDQFLASWKLADASAVREVHEAWPAKRFCVSAAAAPLMAKAFIVTGLSHLGEWLDKCVKPAGRITLLQKPRRMVEALQDLPANTLVLSPETTGIKHLSAKDDAEASPEAVEAVLDPPLKDARFHLQPATGSEAVSAFWFVQTTTDDRKANMVWAKFLISGYFGQDFVGQGPLRIDMLASGLPDALQPGSQEKLALRMTATGPKRKAGTGGAAQSSEPAEEEEEEEDLGPMREVCITVPVLVNKVDIPAGAELLVYRPAQPKKEKQAKPILVTQVAEQAAKKARVA